MCYSSTLLFPCRCCFVVFLLPLNVCVSSSFLFTTGNLWKVSDATMIMLTAIKLWKLVSAFFNKVNAITPHNDVLLFHSFVPLLLSFCCLSSSSSQRLGFIFVLVCDRCFTASFRSNHDNVQEENEKTNDDPSQESLKVC